MPSGKKLSLEWKTSSGLIQSMLSLMTAQGRSEEEVSIACGLWPQETRMRWTGRGDNPILVLEWILKSVGADLLLESSSQPRLTVPLASPIDQKLQKAQARLARAMGAKFQTLINQTMETLSIPVVHQHKVTVESFPEMIHHAIRSRGFTDFRQIMIISGCTDEIAHRFFIGTPQNSPSALHLHRIFTFLGITVQMRIDGVDAATLLPAQMPTKHELQNMEEKVSKAKSQAAEGEQKSRRQRTRNPNRKDRADVIKLLKEQKPIMLISQETGYSRMRVYMIAKEEGIKTAKEAKKEDRDSISHQFIVDNLTESP